MSKIWIEKERCKGEVINEEEYMIITGNRVIMIESESDGKEEEVY